MIKRHHVHLILYTLDSKYKKYLLFTETKP